MYSKGLLLWFPLILFIMGSYDKFITMFLDGHVGGCGITEEVSEWMERVQNSAVDVSELKKGKLPKKYKIQEEVKNEESGTVSNKKRILSDREDRESVYTKDSDSPYAKYSREANVRRKRAARPKEENRNTCSLFIQTDPLIWRHTTEQVWL